MTEIRTRETQQAESPKLKYSAIHKEKDEEELDNPVNEPNESSSTERKKTSVLPAHMPREYGKEKKICDQGYLQTQKCYQLSLHRENM